MYSRSIDKAFVCPRTFGGTRKGGTVEETRRIEAALEACLQEATATGCPPLLA